MRDYITLDCFDNIRKFIYFFAALAGATLTISGYYLWYKKLQAKKKKPKRPAAQKVQK